MMEDDRSVEERTKEAEKMFAELADNAATSLGELRSEIDKAKDVLSLMCAEVRGLEALQQFYADAALKMNSINNADEAREDGSVGEIAANVLRPRAVVQ